jgi:hypothetical protein
MNLIEFDFAPAGKIYGIANTPLFLIRKLQVEPTARAIGDACAGSEIVEALRSMVNTEPANAAEAVRPYVLLLALWYKPEVDYLLEAAKLQTTIYGWYSYVAEVLRATFSSVQGQVIEVSGQLLSPTVSIESSSPSASRCVIVS